jgi:hypothetical protein
MRDSIAVRMAMSVYTNAIRIHQGARGNKQARMTTMGSATALM